MKERRRQFNPINQSRRIDPGYIKSIREQLMNRGSESVRAIE